MNDLEKNNLKKIFSDLGIAKYCIRDPLLAACIGWAHDYPDYEFMEGFSQRKGFGYQLLVEIVSNLFDIRRFPSHEDRIFNNYKLPHDKKYVLMIERFMESLNDSKCELMHNELLSIYNHTQNTLKAIGTKILLLQRSIHSEYCEKVLVFKAAAEMLGKDKVPVDMDVLNSFSDSIGLSAYGDVTFRLKIPTEDILYSHLMITNETNRMSMEGEEWIVINRSRTGIVDICITDIFLDKSEEKKESEDEIFLKKVKSRMSTDFARELFSCDPCEVWRYPYKHINSFLHQINNSSS